MTPFPTVWSQLATCATTGNPRRRAAARNGTALAGWTFESRRPEHSRRIAPSSRAGTCRCALKNHRSIARSTGGQCGSGPSRSVSSIQFGCPGSIRSPWNPCRWLRRIARGWYPMRRSSQASTRPSARSGRPSGETSSSPCRTGSSAASPPILPRTPAARETPRQASPRGARAGRAGSPCRRRPGWRADRGGRPRDASHSSSRGRAGSGGSSADVRGDPLRERRAVQRVEAERLGGRPTRGPAVDAEDRDRRPASAERSASPSPPTGAWSSRTKTCSSVATSAASQSSSKRLSHGMATTRSDSSPLSASRSAARSASWSITGP